MTLRELASLSNSISEIKPSAEVSAKSPASLNSKSISTVSSHSTELEKELYESIARARVIKSPLHKELRKYFQSEFNFEEISAQTSTLTGR